MRNTRLGWAGALALVVLVSATAPAGAEDPAMAKGTAKGDLAPAWVGKTFINSDELTLEGLRGKLVFIEYFGTG